MSFDLEGAHNFRGKVTANANERINTWTVFWCAAIFERCGSCIKPASAFVRDVGNDGSAEHCRNYGFYQCIAEEFRDLPDIVQESLLAVDTVKVFLEATPRNTTAGIVKARSEFCSVCDQCEMSSCV